MKRQYWALLTAAIAVPCWGQAFGQTVYSQGTTFQILTDPIYDAADLSSGTFTLETGLTIEDTEVLLVKCAESTGTCGAQAAKNETTDCAHVGSAQYECNFNGTDSDTVGTLHVYIQDNTAVTPFFRTYQVIETAVFEACCADGAVPMTLPTVADAVWDEDATGHQTQGTFGQAIGDPGADTDTIFALSNTIVADTNEVQTDWADGGRLDLILDARASQASVDTVDSIVDVLLNATVVATVQAADSGSTTTIVDAARTEADADYWRGVAALPLTGTNAGQARCVVDFNAGTDTLTVVPPWTQAITTNSYILIRDTNCVGVDPTYTP
jgi:hypothetical protein